MPGGPELPEPGSAPEPGDERLPAPTGWRRVLGHKALVPSVIAGAAVVVATIGIVTRSTGAAPKALKAIANPRQLSTGVAQQVVDAAKRTSPGEHVVHSYQRIQHHGPGGVETKIVQVASHLRGG